MKHSDVATEHLPSPGSTHRPAVSQRRSDLWLVLGATGACYLISARFELQESFFRRLSSFERWQADELPFTVTVLALGLAWYAWQRRREARSELALRVQAEARIGELLAHNRELTQQLIGLQESERRSLARELHDELGQHCAAIRADAAYIRRCAPDDRDGVLAAAARTDAAAAALYATVHDMLRRLRPANLDALGLVATLQELCDGWSERSGVACTFVQDGPMPTLDDTAETAVVRVAQEALTNVSRHAVATRVDVRLGHIGDAGGPAAQQVLLTVTDDGRGMDRQRRTRGLGLLGAAERAAAFGGLLHIDTAPGAGLRLELVLPAAQPAPAGALAPAENVAAPEVTGAATTTAAHPA